MAIGFPVKDDYVTGDVLTAANMNDLSGTVNLMESAQYVAGKNRIINGAMDFWQRGTTFGPTGASGYFAADRWTVSLTANQMTWAQETSIVPTGFQYAYKATATTGGAAYFNQYIESVNCQDLAGKTVTLSAYCATSASQNVDFVVLYNTTFNANSGTGGWTAISTQAVTTTATMPTTPQAKQFAIPSNSKSLAITIKSSADLANAATMTITGVQLELGSVATTFSRAGGTIQGELANCQRYYYRIYTGSAYRPYGVGQNFSTTQSLVDTRLPVTMRVRPTALEQSGTGADYGVLNANATNNTCNAVPIFDNSTTDAVITRFTVGSGLVAGNVTLGTAGNVATSFLGWSAEL